MSFNQIKNQTVPSAKRTASAATQLLAKLPIPPIAGVVPSLVLAVLTAPLKQALANPKAFLVGAGAALAATAFLGGPVGLAAFLAAGASAVVTYAVLAAAMFMILSVITIYNSRVELAKSIVVLLEAI